MTTLTAPVLRQRLLVLYLSNCSLDSEIVAWARYDGASDREFDGAREADAPYASVLAAMRDGWRVLKFPEMHPATADTAYQTSVLPNEFVLEQIVEVTRA